jgi:hypothetical protein
MMLANNPLEELSSFFFFFSRALNRELSTYSAANIYNIVLL